MTFDINAISNTKTKTSDNKFKNMSLLQKLTADHNNTPSIQIHSFIHSFLKSQKKQKRDKLTHIDPYISGIDH